MGTLARQQTLDANTDRPWSLVRDNQLRAQLEAALTAAGLGPGILSGGSVSHVTGYTVQVENGSVILSEGVVRTLTDPQNYTAAVATSTIYLWAVLTRTAAASTEPTESDTYALTVTHNLTGVAPSALHFPLAVLTTDANGVVSIDDYPAGKYVSLPRAVTLAEQAFSLGPGFWQVEADFSAAGAFSDSGYEAALLADVAGLVIWQDTARKSAGRASWLVMVPASVSAGSVILTATLRGHGWSGSDSSEVAAVWATAAEVEPPFEAVSSLMDEADRLRRALLLWVVEVFGTAPPEELADDFTAALAERG